ncbi:MAG: hypothetical protein QOF72_375 [Blastocatellia bacterium]|jgi:hypothetical protein|nr:hypothetical protein [Blastocatellia bacterium]
MKKLLILAMLIMALTSIARAQNNACPTCNKGYELVTTPTFNTEDGNRYHAPGRAVFNAFYVNFYASVVVTNDTAKRIKQITWETNLVDAATMKTISTYTLVTRKKIAPHAVVTLKRKVEVPLEPKMISGNQLTPIKRGRPNVIRTQQVSKITEIEYTDGSVSSP